MEELLRKKIEEEIILTDPEWEAILKKIERIELKKNQFLQIQNTHSKFVSFVLKGSLKIYILNENGTESIVLFAFDEDWVCNIENFYNQKPSNYNIKAIEDCEIFVISNANKELLFEEVPKMIRFHTLMVEKSNHTIQKRLVDVLNKTSKERYLDFIKKYPTKIKKINNLNLSSYLGVSHEFLSKIKNRM
ncbi:MAG: cyclic nucleotide-binding domain-containing protein [Flavobacterium sp.]